MSKLAEVNEKIAETVVDGYKKIEEGGLPEGSYIGLTGENLDISES